MKIRTLILLILLMAGATSLYAQGPPPPPPPPSGGCATCVPIDGGIGWLIVAAAGLGVARIKKKK